MLDTVGGKLARWAASLALVGTMHGAAISWTLWTPPADEFESQAGGAFIIELSPVTASPDEDARDVAVGRRNEDVAPVAAVSPQVASAAESQPEEMPPLPEMKTAAPEDALPKRLDEKPPEQEKPPEASAAKAEDAPLVTPVEASEAAAPLKIDNAIEKADTPSGQNIGSTRIDRAAIENWQRDLIVHINRHKRYPAHAREARQHGIVTVAFAMDRQGRVVRAEIAKGTGFLALDDAAIDILHRASPLPPPPAGTQGSVLEFVVPVRFRWKD